MELFHSTNQIKKDFENIRKYILELDYCFLLDDTGLDNSELCQEIVDMDPQRIEYIQNETNIGLCASVNRGFKLAIERQANWVLDHESRWYISK